MYFPTKTGFCKSYGNIKVQVLSSLTINRCTFRCMKITKVRWFLVNWKWAVWIWSLLLTVFRQIFLEQKKWIRYKISLSNCHMKELRILYSLVNFHLAMFSLTFVSNNCIPYKWYNMLFMFETSVIKSKLVFL